MTNRRALGTGPQAPASIRATEADLLPSMPAVQMPDLDDLRARGVLDSQPAARANARRTLGTGKGA
ncbi:hypothetical protein HZZ00_37335 (plasmid) [Streptomyces sp. NEAU-sy36]|uniref:hypothetical protein n=1 Tax=unclassified Streptomyces TaxID=2593676 RepID=UPI0015D5BCC8|nr:MULTISPECIES: hypothetical protein [unclassified Streptomyces]QLJ06697.1 hypothetical protein HZZ00_37335 [Streptomyces sp. NEAU-sy36]